MRVPDLGNYLDHLHSEGALDSVGAFTIDVAKAIEKVSQFQLPSSDHYVLLLLACAVNLQAPQLHTEIVGDERKFHFPEVGFAQEELEDLFAGFVKGSARSRPEKARRYLALAIHAAVRNPEMDFRGVTWNGSSGGLLKATRGQLTIQPISHEDPGTILTFRKNFGVGGLSRAVRWMAEWLHPEDPAETLLRRYCRFAPIPVYLGLEEINVPTQGSWDDLVVINQQKVRPLPPESALRSRHWDRDLPFSAYLGTCGAGGGLALIVDGLLYDHSFEPPHARFRAVVWHEHLNRDLTMMSLVEDELLRQFFQQLLDLYAEVQALQSP